MAIIGAVTGLLLIVIVRRPKVNIVETERSVSRAWWRLGSPVVTSLNSLSTGIAFESANCP
jgi:hypothetical protein